MEIIFQISFQQSLHCIEYLPVIYRDTFKQFFNMKNVVRLNQLSMMGVTTLGEGVSLHWKYCTRRHNVVTQNSFV
jgi:hypothetical protein